MSRQQADDPDGWTIVVRRNGWTGWARFSRDDEGERNTDMVVLNASAVWTKDTADGSPRHPDLLSNDGA